MLRSAKFSWSKLQLSQAIIRAVVALMGLLLHKEYWGHAYGQMSCLTEQGMSLLKI